MIRTSLPDLRPMWSLEDCRALVTGGTRGIGWAIAQYLVAAGAEVVFTGRDAQLLRERAAILNTKGGSAIAAVCDVTHEDAVTRLVTHEAATGLDILVNNAGITDHENLASTTTESWDRIVTTNLTSAFWHARAAAPSLIASGRGRIINIGSLWSLLGKPHIHAYAAAKHGLAGLTKTLAAELGEDGVTVNAIAPGYIDTPMNAERVADPAFSRMVTTRTVVGRWGTTDDIAAVVLFLASEAAAYVTGQVIGVDGGITTTF